MKQQPPWIHRFDDGRGIVDRYLQPLTIRRRDGQLITERLHGRVEVVWQTSS